MSKYFNFYRNIWLYHEDKTEADIYKAVEKKQITQAEYEEIIAMERKF